MCGTHSCPPFLILILNLDTGRSRPLTTSRPASPTLAKNARDGATSELVVPKKGGQRVGQPACHPEEAESHATRATPDEGPMQPARSAPNPHNLPLKRG